jgi:hypothetical protein
MFAYVLRQQSQAKRTSKFRQLRQRGRQGASELIKTDSKFLKIGQFPYRFADAPGKLYSGQRYSCHRFSRTLDVKAMIRFASARITKLASMRSAGPNKEILNGFTLGVLIKTAMSHIRSP